MFIASCQRKVVETSKSIYGHLALGSITSGRPGATRDWSMARAAWHDDCPSRTFDTWSDAFVFSYCDSCAGHCISLSWQFSACVKMHEQSRHERLSAYQTHHIKPSYIVPSGSWYCLNIISSRGYFPFENNGFLPSREEIPIPTKSMIVQSHPGSWYSR